MTKRKGATRTADIPTWVLEGLSNGTLESVNLTEWLAVDQVKLLETLLPAWGLGTMSLKHARQRAGLGVMQRTQENALALEAAGADLAILTNHPSDTVRCWAAFIAVQRAPGLGLEAIQAFATDPHFGVREIAWMAWRPRLVAQLEFGLAALQAWTTHADANARRFASEASRPRGVWCAHIETLKHHPELALGLLEALRNDPSKYVQTSVANWLNDASKTRPDWVEATCARWLEQSPTAATAWTVGHALRSLRKSKT